MPSTLRLSPRQLLEQKGQMVSMLLGPMMDTTYMRDIQVTLYELTVQTTSLSQASFTMAPGVCRLILNESSEAPLESEAFWSARMLEYLGKLSRKSSTSLLEPII